MKLPATVPSADLGVLLTGLAAPPGCESGPAVYGQPQRTTRRSVRGLARGGPSHGLEFLPQVWHAGVAAVAYEPSRVLSLPADAARVFPIIVVVGQQETTRRSAAGSTSSILNRLG